MVIGRLLGQLSRVLDSVMLLLFPGSVVCCVMNSIAVITRILLFFKMILRHSCCVDVILSCSVFSDVSYVI
jgi:hypothetical protein